MVCKHTAAGRGLHATAMPYCHTELAQKKNTGKMEYVLNSRFLLIHDHSGAKLVQVKKQNANCSDWPQLSHAFIRELSYVNDHLVEEILVLRKKLQ